MEPARSPITALIHENSGRFRQVRVSADPVGRSWIGVAKHTMKNLFKPLFALLIVLATPAWADISRDQAVVAAQRVASGRVLSADRTEADRRAVWRVKLLSAQGEVRVILIDAASGRVIG